MKNKAEKRAGFASRSFSEGLGDEYMQPEKMVNCTTRDISQFILYFSNPNSFKYEKHNIFGEKARFYFIILRFIKVWFNSMQLKINDHGIFG